MRTRPDIIHDRPVLPRTTIQVRGSPAESLARASTQVRAESRALKLPYYQPKLVRREADHIMIPDVGEGTILDARPLNPKLYEVRLQLVKSGAKPL